PAFTRAQHVGGASDLGPLPVSSDPPRVRLGRDQGMQGPPTAGGSVAGEPLLEARGLVKTFGRVQARRGASFSVYPGEVVALIGDNGAGKSARLKCLSGVDQPDPGEILRNRRPALLAAPLAAVGVPQRRPVHEVIRRVAERGISVVYISHNIPEVLEVADGIEVLRLGVRVATFQAHDASLEQLVGAMTGALTQEDVA